MMFGTYKILVPDLTKYKNKTISTLTKTGNASRRSKEPTISLVQNKKIKRPRVELNIDPNYLKNIKNQKQIINELEGEIKRDRDMIEKIKETKIIKKEEYIKHTTDGNVLFLSQWVGITKPTDKKSDGPYLCLVFDEFFDIIDKKITHNDYKKNTENIEFIQETLQHGQLFVEKKVKAGHTAFIDDFIMLVIYPMLKEHNKNIDKLYLRLFAIEIGDELQKMADGIEPEVNKKTVVKCLLHFKHGTIKDQLFKLDPELKNLFEDYINIESTGYNFVTRMYEAKSKVLQEHIKKNGAKFASTYSHKFIDSKLKEHKERLGEIEEEPVKIETASSSKEQPVYSTVRYDDEPTPYIIKEMNSSIEEINEIKEIEKLIYNESFKKYYDTHYDSKTKGGATSDKYKSSHSTYFQMLYNAQILNWLFIKENIPKLIIYKHIKKPTETDYEVAISQFKHQKTFYVGHNVGGLGASQNNYESNKFIHIMSIVRVACEKKNDLHKFLNSKLKEQNKVIDDKRTKDKEEYDKKVEEHKIKMQDPDFKKKYEEKQKKIIHEESLMFDTPKSKSISKELDLMNYKTVDTPKPKSTFKERLRQIYKNNADVGKEHTKYIEEYKQRKEQKKQSTYTI
jgi:hypothetical protein